jgi:hypothetical protein
MRSRKSDAMKEEAEIILAQLRAAASRSLERVADTFKRWDADGGGLISRSEFRKAALALFIEGEQRAIDAAFDLLDADGNGSLSIEELSAHLLEHRRKSGRDEMSEKKASSSMAMLPNPIKLSSLALSKSDSSLAQFKANLILRTALSAEQAVEAARQTEHDWRVYETTKHHTQQVLSRRIAERAAEVSAQQEKRRQEQEVKKKALLKFRALVEAIDDGSFDTCPKFIQTLFKTDDNAFINKNKKVDRPTTANIGKALWGYVAWALTYGRKSGLVDQTNYLAPDATTKDEFEKFLTDTLNVADDFAGPAGAVAFVVAATAEPAPGEAIGCRPSRTASAWSRGWRGTTIHTCPWGTIRTCPWGTIQTRRRLVEFDGTGGGHRVGRVLWTVGHCRRVADLRLQLHHLQPRLFCMR